MTTKTLSGTQPKQDRAAALKPEYRFNYRKAQPNRLATKALTGSVAVLLDPDVARGLLDAEQDAQSVNITPSGTMPVKRRRGTR